MPRPSWPKAVVDEVVANGDGKCHHCAKPIDTAVRRNFHIDHFPVVYADIEDQVCWGVRDPMDTRNLVLSCPHTSSSEGTDVGTASTDAKADGSATQCCQP